MQRFGSQRLEYPNKQPLQLSLQPSLQLSLQPSSLLQLPHQPFRFLSLPTFDAASVGGEVDLVPFSAITGFTGLASLHL